MDTLQQRCSHDRWSTYCRSLNCCQPTLFQVLTATQAARDRADRLEAELHSARHEAQAAAVALKQADLRAAEAQAKVRIYWYTIVDYSIPEQLCKQTLSTACSPEQERLSCTRTCIQLRPAHCPCPLPPGLQAVRDIEALHSAAADELEALYEARLALERERLAHMTAAKQASMAAHGRARSD